jgi:hypothetical protein
MDKIIPVIYMLGILMLVLPAFLQSNSKLKDLLKNLSVWIIIIMVIMTLIYFLS